MLVRHSLSLTMSNMQLVFKVLLFALIICLIGAALFVTVSDPILRAIGEELNLDDNLRNFTEDIIAGDGAVFNRIINSIDNFTANHPGEVLKAMVLGIILIIVMKLLFALIVSPSAHVINNKMATNFTEGFFHSFMKVGGKGALSAFVYTLISAPIDLIIIAVTYMLGKWMVKGIGLFGIIFACALGLVLITLRMSIMGQWVATLVNENLCFNMQFKRGIRKGFKLLPKIFPAMLTVNILTFGIIATTFIPTVTIIPIVTIPCFLVCFISIQLIAYYQDNDKKYYIDELII